MAKQSQEVPGLAPLAKHCPVVIINIQIKHVLGIRAMQGSDIGKIYQSCCGANVRSKWLHAFQAAFGYAYQQHVYILGSFVCFQLCLNLLEPVTVVLNAVVILQAAMNSKCSSCKQPPTGEWLMRC